MGLLKKVVKGKGPKDSGSPTAIDVRERNTFMHLKPFAAGQDPNVEMPIEMDLRVFTEEIQYYTIMYIQLTVFHGKL